MQGFWSVTFPLFLLQVFIRDYGVSAQGATPAKVDIPMVEALLGNEAKLSCSISDSLEDESNSTSSPSSGLRFCVWERAQQSAQKNQALILNFNEITSQPGLFSGMSGYSYQGEGFRAGECGVKINSVKEDDISKWQCTIITDDKVYRGYVDLKKSDPPKAANNVSPVAFSRTAIDDGDDDQLRPRPIITSYNDARAIIQPEIIVQSTSGDGTQSIQEVKVESAGLQIKPKRGGKLIVFE